jgi:hypothetical protein
MTSLQCEKINNCNIKAPEIKTLEKAKRWKGKNIFRDRYFVLGILGKRRSGKSTLIYNIIKNCVSKNTIVFFYVGTFHKDKSYEEIRNYLDEKGIVYHSYNDIEEREDGILVDNLKVFMEMNLSKTDENEEDGEDEEKPKLTSNTACKFDEIKSETSPSVRGDPHFVRKKKQPEPEYLLIFDDLSTSLKKNTLLKAVKNSRHLKSKFIISTQSVVDISPQLYQQMDYLAVFKNFNEDNLEKIYERVEPPLPINSLQEFIDLYHRVTNTINNSTGYPYFLLIDRSENSYRMDLNKKIIL